MAINITKPNLQKPIIYASVDEWGHILNGDLDELNRFNGQLMATLQSFDSQLVSLEDTKVGKDEADTLIENKVNDYITANLKPDLDDYLTTVLEPKLDDYTSDKKSEIDLYISGTIKPDLDSYKLNIESDLDAYTLVKKGELDDHTGKLKIALDNYEKDKEAELQSFTDDKKVEITTHTDAELERIDAVGINNKLDKGTYSGNAGTLKTEIDGKVSKSGDTMTGTLNINMEGKDKVVLKSKGTTDGVVGSNTDGVIVENSKSGKSIRLNNDGVGIYPSTSLKTEAKDLSGAVNELLDNKYKIEYKTIGSLTEELDILEFALTAVEGNYNSPTDKNLITSLPEGITTKAFECRITSMNKSAGYRAIELRPYNSNDVYINTQIAYKSESSYPMWVGWTKLLNDRDGVILDKQDKGVLGGYNGIFPLTVASKNGIYLLPATNKFYVCVENYSGSSLTAPNANFEELSVFQNRNKLENLSKIKLIFNKKQTTNTGIFTLDDSIEKYKFINIVYAFGGDSTRIESVGSAVFNTDFLKNNYNTQLTFATTYINPNGVDVTFEHLYVKFINGTQINIEENRATPGGTLSNNKIHQIYAWN